MCEFVNISLGYDHLFKQLFLKVLPRCRRWLKFQHTGLVWLDQPKHKASSAAQNFQGLAEIDAMLSQTTNIFVLAGGKTSFTMFIFEP